MNGNTVISMAVKVALALATLATGLQWITPGQLEALQANLGPLGEAVSAAITAALLIYSAFRSKKAHEAQ